MSRRGPGGGPRNPERSSGEETSLTTSPTDRTSSPAPQREAAALDRRIASAVRRARWALFWEDFWPRAAWPLGIVIAFVTVSWLGLWLVLPDAARLATVGVFGLALLASFVAFRGFRLPPRAEAVARVEAVSGYRHRPLATYEDRLPSNADAFARALWDAHRARLTAGLDRMQSGIPHPGLARRDRYALRTALGLVFFVSLFVGAGERMPRIAAAFSGAGLPVEAAARLDAWITPPNYTGRAPIFLTGDVPAATEPDGSIRVPEGSLLVVRAPGGSATPVAVTAQTAAGVRTVERKAPDPNAPAVVRAAAQPGSAPAEPPTDFELALTEAATVAVARGQGRVAEWRFSVDPDQAPTIRLVAKPEIQRTGSMKLAYEVSDDYGVVAAEAKFEPSAETFKTTSTTKDVRPLVAAPEFPLTLPQGRAKTGQAQTFRDVASHPWAGSTVKMVLIARDEANKEGRSEAVDVRLPAKSFTKPLARALVEQRRILALDANRAARVTDAVDALMIAPDKFYDHASPYLGVRMVHRALVEARSDDDLRAVLDLIWAVALSIEDGDLSAAEKALRDAQEALRKAIEEGASEKEIARLTQELRDALDKYLRELAQRAMQNPQARAPQDPNQRTMRKQDLDRMLNRIEDLARTGSKDAAKQLLSQLQQMLENLQAGRPQQRQQGQQNEMNEALDRLGEMIQRQQQLMDRTHRMDPRNAERNRQGQNRRGQTPEKPMTPEEFAQAMKELREKQNELQQALRELQDKMNQQGMGQQGQEGQEGQQGRQGQQGKQGRGQQGQGQGGQAQRGQGSGPLGEADDAMGDAADALGQGQTGSATDAQGRALDALRQGARELADQMAQQQGQGQPGMGPEGESSMNDDPLGRPRRHEGPDYSNTVKVPDEIDVQRARRILEDIRRRLGESYRPQFELDYLERLLRSE